ncbi:4-(cytidine 5'-diphospho)-2-C-methyl-D-erythritol kinase [Actinospongicola halichondriae]|uniref:4-(cytidine 5'-diphospho)-2-C-methyl-D-erythritol kinase n=1 Tax=Actinospongicola halichondriae TaxID=3236844 RepID=UPI003D5BF208
MTTVEAPAKLTRTLRVTGVRDDGYHLIDAEMVSLDLADELTFEDGDSLVIDGPESTGLSAGPDNLVARALRAAGRSAAVRVHKRIPAGGGLGGGSADAAAVLRWAGVHDLDLAARLGADVPFCLHGGRARVTGIGEELEHLPYEPMTFTVSTPPEIRCDTAAVYRAWDDLGGPTVDGPNDLEPAALRVAPELARFRDAFGDATGETPVLAGSGSTWFVPGSFPGAGRLVVHTTPSLGDEPPGQVRVR